MSTMKFEKDGVVRAFHSTVPGVMIVPPGFEHGDGVQITKEEFDSLMVESGGETPTLAQLTQLARHLQSQIDRVSQTNGTDGK